MQGLAGCAGYVSAQSAKTPQPGGDHAAAFRTKCRRAHPVRRPVRTHARTGRRRTARRAVPTSRGTGDAQRTARRAVPTSRVAGKRRRRLSSRTFGAKLSLIDAPSSGILSNVPKEVLRRKNVPEFKLRRTSSWNSSGNDHRCSHCGVSVGPGRSLCLRCEGMRHRQARQAASNAPRRRAIVFWALTAAALFATAAAWITWRKARQAAKAQETIRAEHASLLPESIPEPRDTATTAGQAAPRQQTQAHHVHTVVDATTGNQVETVFTCPQCRGARRLRDETGQTYRCPVCNGAGSRTRRYSEDVWRVCPQCGGMGYIGQENPLFRTRRRISSQACVNCNRRGLVSKD